MNWHVVPAAGIPRNKAEQIEMLYLAWEAIDEWIDRHRL